MKPRIVVFGYGNPSRGDDALGPMLLDRVEAWLAVHPEFPVELVTDFQLQIEHALDLQGADLALFLDADVSCPHPFALRQAVPLQDASYSSHALSPEAVLHVCRELSGTEPPPSYILSIRGERFELGEPLSPAAERNLEEAWRFLQKALRDGCAHLEEVGIR
ncbi:MAG TPA: hydrogenase maturation protease [Geothrix sp.]|nr:hydrogenase maturation protease [Geothrix sp.]